MLFVELISALFIVRCGNLNDVATTFKHIKSTVYFRDVLVIALTFKLVFLHVVILQVNKEQLSVLVIDSSKPLVAEMYQSRNFEQCFRQYENLVCGQISLKLRHKRFTRRRRAAGAENSQK